MVENICARTVSIGFASILYLCKRGSRTCATVAHPLFKDILGFDFIIVDDITSIFFGLIDWIVFNAVLAIFQPFSGGAYFLIVVNMQCAKYVFYSLILYSN